MRNLCPGHLFLAGDDTADLDYCGGECDAARPAPNAAADLLPEQSIPAPF